LLCDVFRHRLLRIWSQHKKFPSCLGKRLSGSMTYSHAVVHLFAKITFFFCMPLI
jgi:hypothetical protein